MLSSAPYLILSLLFTASTPWQSESVRRTPWDEQGGGSAKQKSREGFFRSLSFGGADAPDGEHEEGGAIQNLPWKDYQGKWTGEPEREFAWPVQGGRISSGFGQRRGRLHEGLDIAAGVGQSIRAAASGRIVYSSRIRGYGNVVVVAHGKGTSTIYAHNRENLVQVGQIVARGQVIATVGSTGRASGNHVHFEVRQNGIAMNPLRFEYERNWEVATSE